jgi:3-hydroxy-9,10-secoandrosta-1,3,5(10)-triene-9,17-dione monooxygenase
VLQPKRYGGYEMDPEVFYRIQMALAEGCMSSAWVYGVVAVRNWQIALFDERAQEEVWGEDSSVLASSTYMPVGKVTPVEGGFRLYGHWSFSSGSEHCAWVLLGGLVPPKNGEGAPEYRIVRNWDVLGLRGTGSHDIVVEDAFVPEYRTHKSLDGFHCDSPGNRVNEAPLYRLPFAQIFVRAVSTGFLGALQGTINPASNAPSPRTTPPPRRASTPSSTRAFRWHATNSIDSQVQALFERVRQEQGRLDILVMRQPWHMESSKQF